MSFNNLFLVALCLLAGQLYAQSTQQAIKLLDQETALPIVQATYQYGEQAGASGENGLIYFRYDTESTMSLSHVNYGEWTLTEKELQAAIQQQVYYRKEVALSLYPVTIIGVRFPEQQPEAELNINYQDRMRHDAASILRQVPAFSAIQKSGNYGFDPVFRGFKYDQLNVVLNGAQSATAACPNRMDPPTSQMAPNMMERIEVLKGPHALRFGTGFGATINFIPTPLRFSDQAELYGRVSTAYESNGNLRRGESQIGFSGSNYDLSVFGSWSQGDDYTAGNGETVQADFTRGSFGTNLGLRLAANQQLRLSTIYNRARDADFPALPMDLREDDTWMFNARHDIQLNKDRLQSWNTTVFGSFVDHLMDNLLKPLDPRMMNAATLATTYNYGGRTEGVWRFGEAKLYSGFDVRVEGAEGTRERTFLMGPNAGNTLADNAWQDGRISKTALFTEYQITGGAFQYIFSGRLEWNQARIDDPSGEFTEVYTDSEVSQVNPSLSLGILRSFSPAVKTGLWLGRAQRSGSLTERFINYFPVGQDPFEMLGNPQLDPEVNNQVDLTFQWTANDKSVLDIDLFAAYLQDYISSVIDPTLSARLPMSPGVRRFVNIEDAFKTGLEISWTQQLLAGLQHQLGVAYTYGQDLERDEPLPEIAPLDFRYVLSGNYLKGRLRPELSLRYVAEQARVSTEFGETVTPDFALLDVEVGYQLTETLSINAGVNNLFDENYFEHLNRSVRGTANPIFAPGRNVFANLNLTF